MSAEDDAYNELCCYTLNHGDSAFIHQHVVDAWNAQHATEQSKLIGVTFALIGLYLHVEREVTGKQVQRVHMKLARQKHAWPKFTLPAERGSMTAVDVMKSAPGPERAIDAWCASVWDAFRSNREAVVALLKEHKII